MREYKIERLSKELVPQSIGTISAGANQLATYEFDYRITDSQPLLFRLQMIDWMGQIQYSNQIEIKPPRIKELVYPNPAIDGYIQILKPRREYSRLEIYNLHGRLLKTIDSPSLDGKVNLDDLPKGVYSVVLIGKEVSWTKLILE